MGRKFKNMMTVLGKPKKQTIKITYYDTPGDPGVLFTTNGIGVNQITQKSGSIPQVEEKDEEIVHDTSDSNKGGTKVIITKSKFNEFFVEMSRL